MAAYISFQPSDFFKAQVYTGTGAENARTFPETTAMKPDFVWIKARSGSKSHRLSIVLEELRTGLLQIMMEQRTQLLKV